VAEYAKIFRAYDIRGTVPDELDGLTVSGGPWWFNLRPSNTEPLLRPNVEAPDEATLVDIRDQVLRIVHDDAG
jgi:phosphomannomutase